MKKFLSLDEMENSLVDFVRKMLTNIPELVNNNYSIVSWTYTKTSLTEMKESNLLDMLRKKLLPLEMSIENEESESMKSFYLIQLILFLIAWYAMKYSGEWWSSSFKNPVNNEK